MRVAGMRGLSKRMPIRSVSGADAHVGAGGILDRIQRAARAPRRHPGVVLFLDPVVPIRPPGSGCFFGGFHPVLEFAGWLAAGPELVFSLGGRIDHAGDMARAGHDVCYASTEKAAAAEPRF